MSLELPDADLKCYSCLVCRQRKVKCDRRAPCSNCVKAKKECSFIPPVRGKRKRTKPPKEGLHAKLKRYEEMLKSYGVKLEPTEDDDDSDSEMASQPDTEMVDDGATESRSSKYFENEVTKPKLIIKEGMSRYFDSAPWSKLGDEHPEVGDMDGPTFHESGMFLEHEHEHNIENLASLHPSPQVLSKLKDIYADRVDPMIKILHLPTFWTALTNGLRHPPDMSKSLEAEIFAFYLATISALREDECPYLFGMEKSAVFPRYRLATRKALVNAGFMSTSSPMTLRAYAIFMMCVRNSYRCDTLYALSGIAIRLARKMGLHRDGTVLGLSPFETEMRRRLWWHLIYVDFRTGDVLGAKPSLDIFSTDTKIPLNVDDSDIYPDLVTSPPERNGITPITFSLVKYETMEAMRKFSTAFSDDLRRETLVSHDVTLAKKVSVISEIEDRLESKYLRYCDPSDSLHTFVSIVIRSSICKMRLSAHTRRQFGNGKNPVKISQNERDIVFANAMKLLEYVTLMQGHQGLEKYMWQIGTSYLWNTVLCVLIEARHRKTGPEVDRSWQLIGSVLSHYPQVFEKSGGPVYIALGKWTLEVWDHYVVACKNEGFPEPSTPDYIEAIRRSRRPELTDSASSQTISHEQVVATTADDAGWSNRIQSEFHQPTIPPDFGPVEYHDFSDLLSFEMDPNEWEQWEQLVAKQSEFLQVHGM